MLNAAGTQLKIFQNGNPVLQVTLTDATSGVYEVTQLGPIVHPPGFGEIENDVAFAINYRVTDATVISLMGCCRSMWTTTGRR